MRALKDRPAMKRIAVFFDGTWNRPDAADPITNVVKLHRAVHDLGTDNVRQVTHYELGIATEKELGSWTFAAGAIGVGVAERIQAGYRYLVDAYQPGDEIYIFGFSRGAYQARSLGAMITSIGVLKPEAAGRIEEAWTCYQSAKDQDHPKRLASLQSEAYRTRIRLIGVWDTVGNLGVPFAPKRFDIRELEFHDTRLSERVDVGLHALAIDEPRGPFAPTFWTWPKARPGPHGQIIEQVWFPGCHANVGGGYQDAGLSDISLLWMAERTAALTGLSLDLVSLRREAKPDPLAEAVMPTSDGVFRVSHVLPYIRVLLQDGRAIRPLRRAFFGGWRTSVVAPDDQVVGEAIHESAFQRYGRRVKLRRGEEVRDVVYKPRPLKVEVVRRMQTRDEA